MKGFSVSFHRFLYFGLGACFGLACLGCQSSSVKSTPATEAGAENHGVNDETQLNPGNPAEVQNTPMTFSKLSDTVDWDSYYSDSKDPQKSAVYDEAKRIIAEQLAGQHVDKMLPSSVHFSNWYLLEFQTQSSDDLDAPRVHQPTFLVDMVRKVCVTDLNDARELLVRLCDVALDGETEAYGIAVNMIAAVTSALVFQTGEYVEMVNDAWNMHAPQLNQEQDTRTLVYYYEENAMAEDYKKVTLQVSGSNVSVTVEPFSLMVKP